ncbi:hypothetical protein EDEG_01077 [Edhazardia aedis USNM 41457]|uniref:Uncharacterized protein n=1 Tax=Edhazardia aedis (strain USNM 41457) TaxID=1003232 RepID=J9DB64_EDHAE|nr:hypothetical protein EDEG_01077 [Edhazardia aedis USNM 41457]|eukprot:EJW04734.1 hypothetical protein EDEG_01077 [Edhazardia aedis USNM 41457]
MKLKKIYNFFSAFLYNFIYIFIHEKRKHSNFISRYNFDSSIHTLWFYIFYSMVYKYRYICINLIIRLFVEILWIYNQTLKNVIDVLYNLLKTKKILLFIYLRVNLQ